MSYLCSKKQTKSKMERRIPFTKMHGAGNDYIYVNTLLYSIPNPEETSRQWSAPHTGIGADGLVLIGFSDDESADYQMRIFNADGSEAMMCGNASRCIGKYLYEKGITDKTDIRLQTRSGIKRLKLNLSLDGNRNRVESITVDMLAPQLNVNSQYNPPVEGVLTVGNRQFEGTFVSMGNPHYVIFTDDVASLNLEHWGPLLENHPAFPERCNIEFAEITNTNSIRVRVWERGSGITMACGTGTCATAVAACLTGRTGRHSSIAMDGGTLEIDWRQTDSHVLMTGPAAFVFEGEATLPPTADDRA